MQKFYKGDLVRVAKDLGPHMGHFTADCDAIVIGSYADQYGGRSARNQQQYTLHLNGIGRCSWYDEEQLTLTENGRMDKLQAWKEEADLEHKQKSDLDWAFSNGAAVLERSHGASIQALAHCFGLTDLWGSHGEGFVYHENARGTLQLAEPFLKAGDKAGWLAHCELLRANV